MKVTFNKDYAQLNIIGIQERDLYRILRSISMYRNYLRTAQKEIQDNSLYSMVKAYELGRAITSMSKLYEALSEEFSSNYSKLEQPCM